VAQLASYIELDGSAPAHNARILRGLIGAQTRFGAVIKGNAYGHGFREMLPLAAAAADVLYVIDPADALKARAFSSSKQIVVLGAMTPEEAVELARADVDAVVADDGAVAWGPALGNAGLTLRVHVHVDTGLGREGFTPDKLPALPPELRVVGALSHFANTEDVTEQDYAGQQLRAFEQASARLGSKLERHFAASAAAMLLPASRFDTVRVGISFYGLWPSSETRLSARAVLGLGAADLKPVLSWRCPSQAVKWLKAGSYVGYGCTYRCPSDTRIAVLPVGYFDGYPRLLSGRAHALVNGQRCPVLGRVMMNHVVIDVTRAVGDEAPLTATLLGRDGDEVLSADQLASWAQTINYELVTRIGPHLHRKVKS
jgi:alanine racemase